MATEHGQVAAHGSGEGLRRHIDRLAVCAVTPRDNVALVWFRVLFGLIMVWEVARYFYAGWISRYYIEPEVHFTYLAFHWVEPLPGDLMYLHFAALGMLAVLITVGLFYRVATALFCIGFWYVFFLDSTRYLNHLYLVGLISFIMIFIPAHRSFSIDAWRNPALRTSEAPCWTLWWLRIQLGIVYTYAGIAKINADWLHGEPMRAWLAARTDVPLVGSWFTEEWMVYLFAYGGMLLDLLIVPLLLWPRTRVVALVLGIAFHLMNARLFNIGIFPWFMIASMVLFLPNSWLKVGLRKTSDTVSAGSHRARTIVRPSHLPAINPAQYLSLALIVVFLVWQIAFPLRHHAYPDNVAWNEDGHRFSWRMMLRSKQGDATFHVFNPVTREAWTVNPDDHLLAHQAPKLPTHPDMILQFSHYLADRFRAEGHDVIEVRAEVYVSLNGRPAAQYVDPDVNLAEVRNTFRATSWVNRGVIGPVHEVADSE